MTGMGDADDDHVGHRRSLLMGPYLLVPPVAQAMMVEYDKKVAHYEIAYTYQRE